MRCKIIYISKRRAFLFGITLLILFGSMLLLIYHLCIPANRFIDPKTGIIVIDAGHGGIDGGASRNGIIEKEVNLAIALTLKDILTKQGLQVVMTREDDVSLGRTGQSVKNRHMEDLKTRAAIINNSDAQLFISIHVNSNVKKPKTKGSIVFYNDKFEQNKLLAYSIQRQLNSLSPNGKSRSVHDPRIADFYLLKYAKIPGVLVETAFITNAEENKLLAQSDFRAAIAQSIADGVESYLNPSEPELRHN